MDAKTSSLSQPACMIKFSTLIFNLCGILSGAPGKVKVGAKYGWMSCIAPALSRHWTRVGTLVSASMTAAMLKMLEWHAQVNTVRDINNTVKGVCGGG